MGKLRQFAIVFDDDKDVFEAGQCIQGHAVVELAEDMKVRGLWLLFHGRSHVEWEHGSGDSSTTYEATETYFHHEVTLFGKARGEEGEPAILPSGRHVFPFRYQLPTEGLPCSFEGEYGSVCYVVKGTIDEPWKFNHTKKRPFTVLDKGDVNQVSQEGSNASQCSDDTPVRAHESKMPGCLCCMSGPVELRVNTERSVYGPGEQVVIRGNVDNNSSMDVTHVEARLVQIAIFHGTYTSLFSEKTKTKTAKKTVQRAWVPGCKSGQSLTFGPSNGAVLKVPLVPPSLLRFCKIIDLEYRLDVLALLEGTFYMSNMKTRIPITISYRHDDRGTPPSGLPYAVPPAVPDPFTPSTHRPLPAVVDNQPTPQLGTLYGPGLSLAPPSYAESVSGATNSDYTMADLNFTPKYTYYDWSKHGQV